MRTTNTTKYGIVEYNNDNKTMLKIYNRLLKFYIELDQFSGEVLMQSDNVYIKGPQVLSEIADEFFKFKVEEKE